MRIEIDNKHDKAERIDFFQTLYDQAKASAESAYADFERHLRQYKGGTDIDGSDTPAKQVRNITYELIESQITSYIPTPSVSPKAYSDRNERNAKSIETLLSRKRDELPFEKMNDMDERYAPIYGGSVWLIEWDESITTHYTVGDVRVTCLSPMHFIGQPNIYEINDMEYCFITFETTKEDLMRRYDVVLEVAEETESENGADDHTATLVVCYYKDDNDKVCQYIWSGETELLHVEDYYARKRKYCRICGKREGICTCEHPKYETRNEEYEEILRDIPRSDGSVIPAMGEMIRDGQIVYETVKQPLLEEDGSLALENVGGAILPVLGEVQVPRMEQTRLPFYTPSVFPIVIRKNTSQEDSLFGQSDCEFIRPQQQGINKLESRIHEKLIGSGVFPIVPKDANIELDNSIFQKVFRASENDFRLYGRVDLQVDTSRDVAQSERLYDQAKRILGISDSFQGQYDGSAQSGRAKQLQIQQAAGRLESKRQMKNAAYAEIDRVIFQFYLAYADEPRPAAYRDAQGRMQNVVFSRYDYLERDEVGEWYYNDQFLFRTDATIDVEKSRETLWAENRQNFQSGAYGDPALPQTQLIFWQNMESAHYPWAHDNVERIKQEIARQQELAAAQQQISALQGEVLRRAEFEKGLVDRIAEAEGEGGRGAANEGTEG